MPVQNRIKIIQVSNFEEAESKINDFLAFDESIIHLANIQYRLEFNFVIIEYYVMNQNKNNNIIIEEEEEEERRPFNNFLSMYDGWFKLCLPFFSTPYSYQLGY